MLCSLPRLRSVVEISYGCMGRSARQPNTARASGLETRRRVMTTPLRVLGFEYLLPFIRCQVGGASCLDGAPARLRAWRIPTPSGHPRRLPVLLQDRIAVIYGGGGAIGGAVARAFAREGADVFLAGRTRGPLDEVAADIRA